MSKLDKKYAGEYVLNPSAGRGSPDRILYIGDWYIFDKDKKTVKKGKVLSFSFALFSAALFIFCGFLDCSANFTPYVFLPFVILFLPICFLLYNSFMLFFLGEKLTHKQFDKNVAALKRYAVAVSAISSLSLVCDILMYFISESKNLRNDIVFTIGLIFIVVFSAFCVKIQQYLTCSQISQ